MFGKSTHISMISNSVTHLQHYTNSAITDIAGNSTRAPTSPSLAPMLPCRAERWCRRAERLYLCIESQYHRIKWRVFRDVSQCFKCFMMFHNVFKSVSWCFTSGSRCFDVSNVSQCFTSVSWCFTMFNNVFRCLVSHATNGIANRRSPQGSRQRHRDRR